MNYVAFIRRINVSGRNEIAMAELKSLCVDVGWGHVETLFQTWDVMFTSDDTLENIELELGRKFENYFTFAIPSIVIKVDEFARRITVLQAGRY